MDELESGARAIGLATVAVQWNDKPIPFQVGSTPAIIPVVNPAGKRHFVAVLASRCDQLFVLDFPASAKWILTSDLRNRLKWNGQALHVSANASDLKPLTSQLPFWPETFFYGIMAAGVLYLAIRSVRGGAVMLAGQARRRGVTLVEVLVALAIMNLLAAIVLPAVQSLRGRADQMRCAHHLKQLALAASHYESTHQQFPPMHAAYIQFPAGIFHRQTLSLQARLLPELDQAAVFQRIDMNETGGGAQKQPPVSPYNAALLTQRIPVFECPSDSVMSGGISYRIPIECRHGVFRPPLRGRRIAEYRDGTSSTILFAEKLVGDGQRGRYTPWRDTAMIAPQAIPSRPTLDALMQTCRAHAMPSSPDWSYGGSSWLFSSFQHACYNHALTPNSTTADCQEGWVPSLFGPGAITPRSLHSGGVNVVFADGSCRFVSDSIDLAVWRAAGTVDGGEVTGEF